MMTVGIHPGYQLYLCALLLLLAIGVWADPVNVTGNVQISGVVDIVGNGKIDWTKQELRAIGIGFAPKTASGARATILAREAAIVVAERNLLKVIDGVHITSETTVRNLVLEDDTIKTRVEGLLKGAVILSEKALPDNGYQIVLCIDLYGTKQSLAQTIDLPKQWEALRESVVVPPTAADKGEYPAVPPANPPAAPATVEEPAAGYTGLIVDCRGLSLTRSMCPRLLDQTGKSLWSTEQVSIEMINEKGIAGYSRSLDEPELQQRVGKRPLTVKALRTAGGKYFKTDAVLSPADCERVLAANAKSLFLDKLNVVFLID